ncbi:MAG: hypothetical protein R3342_04400 [Lutibacter sp.]|uniref:hypothetical protein n=1 Tax=Lutibacter sp. TaxID=1925666 RepID=UPI00299D18CC|nr:hypothetical protein [Lutibacter sp.]MDX1828769.1 hypothetical protein [Lutibacter sp.]
MGKSSKFSNSISTEKYYNFTEKEKEEYLVKNNIYKKRRIKYSNEHLNSFKKNGELFKRTHIVNELVLDEIINYFLDTKEAYTENFAEIQEVKMKIENAFDKIEIENILRKNHKKYFQKLFKIDLSFWYFLGQDDYRDYGEKDFIDHISCELDRNLIEEFITHQFIDFDKNKIFNQWIKIEKYNGVLKALKVFKNEYLSEENNKSIKPLTLNKSILLMDYIISFQSETWGDIAKTKKAKLLSKLFNKDYTNTLRGLRLLEKKPSETTQQFKNDEKEIKNFIKSI